MAREIRAVHRSVNCAARARTPSAGTPPDFQTIKIPGSKKGCGTNGDQRQLCAPDAPRAIRSQMIWNYPQHDQPGTRTPENPQGGPFEQPAQANATIIWNYERFGAAHH